MPTYQYACTACDHRFEAVQPFTDASMTECPACSGGLRKVFSSIGIVFKGSGFYRNDSRAGAGSTVAPSEGKSESKGEAKGEPSTNGSSTSSSSTSAGSSSTPAAAAAS